MSNVIDPLQALLGASTNVEKDVYISRLGANFRIKALDTDSLNKAREQATHYIGKGSKREAVTDNTKLHAILITKLAVAPDFTNKALHEKYGVSNSVDCVQKALLPGEVAKLIAEGWKLSGFDDDEDAIDEIKN
ncbi:phage tail assembly chaperone [Paenibacillus agricola]|uniref:XkdN-like tail assembly chaperone n=1 Tax=Paenibacillus agricola TaxID=2716264 RepID=A0ABX0J672_9BACL|nr:hypothetical protein [Paenibacillus agricola]NHN31128.1 hypothetical protein [Paenibacillus agricola]